MFEIYTVLYISHFLPEPNQFKTIDDFIVKSNDIDRFSYANHQPMDFKSNIKITETTKERMKSEINYFINMRQDNPYEVPLLFEIDSSFEHDNFIKIKTNRTRINNVLRFILNIKEDFLNIQKQLFNEDNLIFADSIITHHSTTTNNQITISDYYHQFVNGGKTDYNDIAMISSPHDNAEYFNYASFIKEVISNYKILNIDTYYLCKSYIGFFEEI